MNASEFGCGAGHQLAITAAKAGWELTDFTSLTQSEDKCRQVLTYLRGLSEIRPIEHLIDFDKAPSVPEGWMIVPDSEQLPNRVRGVIKFTPAMVKLHLDAGQKNGKVIEGNELRKKLDKVPVYGAQLGDFYMANPHLIPEDWKGNAIFFWGTIYRRANGGLFVRCLFWDGDGWVWGCRWLVDGWSDSRPAAVSAS